MDIIGNASDHQSIEVGGHSGVGENFHRFRQDLLIGIASGDVREDESLHLTLKTEKTGVEAEKLAAKRHDRLRPIPKARTQGGDTKALADLADRHARVKEAITQKDPETKYLLVQDEQDSGPFYKPLVADGVLVAVLNSNHLFFRKFYEPLVGQNGLDSAKASHVINLMLLAATRAEALLNTKDERKTLAKFRREWSQVLDALLRS